MAALLGEFFIRRSIGTPPGTVPQRMAWADATPGGNLVRIAHITDDDVYITLPTGPMRITHEQLEVEWERP